MSWELERRPALLICLGLIAGIAALHYPPIALSLVLLAFVRGLGPKLFFVSAFIIGALLSPKPRVEAIERQKVYQLQADVVSVPRLVEGGAMCEIDTSLGRLFLKWNGEPDLILGCRIIVSGSLRPPSEGNDFYWALRSIRGFVNASNDGIRVVEPGSLLASTSSNWRRNFVSHTDATLSPKAAEIVDALCFNVDAPLGAEMRENLQRTGTTHIISASGLHVFFLALALQILLSLLPVPRWLQLLLLCLVLAAYACATGLRPPIVRACLMSGALFFGFLFRRESDLLSALAIAGTGYLLINPDSVFDIGFQLSFLSVGALALYAKPLSEQPRSAIQIGMSQLKEAGRASWIATLAAGPAVAYHFGIFSVIGVVANVLIAFVLLPIMVFSMMSLAIEPYLHNVSLGIMQGFVSPLAGWVLWVVETLGSWNYSAFRIPEFSPYWLALYYLMFVATWRRSARPA